MADGGAFPHLAMEYAEVERGEDGERQEGRDLNCRLASL